MFPSASNFLERRPAFSAAELGLISIISRIGSRTPISGAFTGESEIVKEIFDKFAQGFTGVTIANDLRKRGIRNKFGNPFTEKLVYKIIENTKYNGKVKHGDTIYTNIYPAIIDDITWQKVQTIRTSNKHAPGRKKDVYEYILSSKQLFSFLKML